MAHLRIIPLIFMGLSPTIAAAQERPPPAETVRAAMAKLAWLEGEWLGEGWRIGPQGKEEFQAKEVASWRLDGLVLLLNGLGWSEEDGERVVGHKALGLLSYDVYAKTYRFDAYVTQGYQSRSEPEIAEGYYRWSVPAGPGAEMRYTAQLTPEGEWLEIGERCAGDNCMQTFEMRLRKTGDE